VQSAFRRILIPAEIPVAQITSAEGYLYGLLVD
jgi:hypothetical protein